jgi:hypothetical protein
MGYIRIISENGVQDSEDMTLEELMGVYVALMSED